MIFSNLLKLSEPNSFWLISQNRLKSVKLKVKLKQNTINLISFFFYRPFDVFV